MGNNRFNPDKLPTDFYQIAHRQIETQNDKLWATGGILIGGAIAAITGSVPMGVVFFAYGIWQGWREVGGKNKSEEALEDYGCVAHLLDKDALNEYASKNGFENTLKQIDWASSKGYSLTPAARKLKKVGQNFNSSELVKKKDGSNELIPSSKWLPLVSKLPLRIITGVQGSGKSTLERYLISELKKLNYQIIILNPETNPEVWGGVEVYADADKITKFLKELPTLIKSRAQEARDKKIDEDDYLVYLKENNMPRLAVFFQEINTYEAQGVEQEALGDALKQCLTNIRKWGVIATVTAHSDNQTSISSSLKGFSGLLNSIPSIECIEATSNTGEAIGSGKGLLRLKGSKDNNPLAIQLENYPKTKLF